MIFYGDNASIIPWLLPSKDNRTKKYAKLQGGRTELEAEVPWYVGGCRH